ncbi:MAG TPA: globin family protein [Gemmatimonadaceae bacterium]|nr:globin family protein [Gemmatimonadaceae bacterium]
MTIRPASKTPGPGVSGASFSTALVAELQRSWEQVVPMADEAAQLFYARLFELDPSLRRLFHTDPVVQRRKLMEALAFVVTCADQPNDVLPMLSALGGRHAGYGVRKEHYTTAGEALLWTLDQGLGLLHTKEARDAWVAAYDFVASAMCDGAMNDRLQADSLLP